MKKGMPSEKIAVLNCSLDLQRAAKFYFLDPFGSTSRTFLKHAKHVLSYISNKKAKDYLLLLRDIEAKMDSAKSPLDREHIADKLLTAGIMLKGIAQNSALKF